MPLHYIDGGWRREPTADTGACRNFAIREDFIAQCSGGKPRTRAGPRISMR